MLRGVIFDIDGTLLDSMGIWEELGQRLLSCFGISGEEKLGERLRSMSMEEGIRYLRSVYGLKPGEEELRTMLQELLQAFYSREAMLKPGAEALVRQLQRAGIPMVLATSGDRGLAEAALRRLGILEAFQGMVTCDEAGSGKESPEIYLLAAEQLQLPPGEICVLEDLYRGVHTAAEAGFYVIGVRDRFSSEEEVKIRGEARQFVESLSQVDPALFGIRESQDEKRNPGQE